MYTNGIDVSVAQGPIDWRKVRAAGIRFAYVRGYHATDRDVRVDDHLAGADAAGVITGVYLFPDFKRPARDQILAIADLVRRTYLPLAIDCEDREGLGADVILAWIRDAIVVCFELFALKPLIYTMPSFWRSLEAAGTSAVDVAVCDLWIANYGVGSPIVPQPWTAWRFWQHHANTIWKAPDGTTGYGAWRMPTGSKILASAGLVPGVAGEVDCNFFNGSIDELRAWARLSPSVGA